MNKVCQTSELWWSLSSDVIQQSLEAQFSTMSTETSPGKAAESVWIRGDLYGLPDPVSNLPRIRFTSVADETAAEKGLREQRQSVHDWNQLFWAEHNSRFNAVSVPLFPCLEVFDRLIDWSVDCSIYWPIHWLIDSSIDRLIAWLVDCLIDGGPARSRSVSLLSVVISYGAVISTLQEKEAFIAQLPEKRANADELAVFYKSFLDRNHRSHMEYNKELYRRSVGLLWPELLVCLQRVARKFVK